jgi:hypothetical protein
MRDLISTAILDSQVHGHANGQTRWQLTFVNNETWTGAIERLGSVYVLHGDNASIYFCASQVIYLMIAPVEPCSKGSVRQLLNS